jgi:hypothetical protein
MQFAVTPNGQIGLVTKKYPDGRLKLDIWGRDEAYIGEATIQNNPVHPDCDKFREVVNSMINMGAKASFFYF